MRERFIPRILRADPATLIDETGENFDPAKVLACMLQREKSGGHSERSIAIGTIEVALWDAVAKIERKPLHRVLAERYNGGRIAREVFCYVGGGWYLPGRTIADLQDEMRRHLDAGYTLVKMKIGGLPLDEDLRRLEAVLAVVGTGSALAVDANCKFERADALAYAQALAPYGLRWFEEPCDPLDFALLAEIASRYAGPLASGENLFSTQDVENLVRFGGWRADRDIIQVDPPQSYGIVQYARTLAVLEFAWLEAQLAVPPWRQPDVLAHRRRLRPRRRRILSGRVWSLRRLCGRRQAGRWHHQVAGASGHRLRGAIRALRHHAGADRLTLADGRGVRVSSRAMAERQGGCHVGEENGDATQDRDQGQRRAGRNGGHAGP